MGEYSIAGEIVEKGLVYKKIDGDLLSVVEWKARLWLIGHTENIGSTKAKYLFTILKIPEIQHWQRGNGKDMLMKNGRISI